ncbi:DMP19 family protein [Chitinophaga sp. 22321]|uniref:DUF4375 domain-containing protein n=1 Tax=Chitinophaga hostae TaxID=2831022 RepID=A0ABS5IZP2_9BACT|nr:DUF4375 domain-containing protein [Chitinophaga hostae]MBS0028251.1 DUF4375 domain-containing protein [Chitinophaga hostae]
MNNEELISYVYTEAVSGLKEEWFLSQNGEWYDYIVSLPSKMMATYLVVVLDNQLFNGGFHQYFANTYGQFALVTIDAFKSIGAYQKATIIENAYQRVNDKNEPDIIFRKKLLSRKIEALFINDNLFTPLDKLDDKYESIDKEDIVTLLANYLRQEL